MTTYYLPLDADGYPIGDEAFPTDAQAYDVVKDYMGENRIHEAMYNHGCVEELTVTADDNPYDQRYWCVDEAYDGATDGDHRHGIGHTHQEAIQNYIEKIS